MMCFLFRESVKLQLTGSNVGMLVCAANFASMTFIIGNEFTLPVTRFVLGVLIVDASPSTVYLCFKEFVAQYTLALWMPMILMCCLSIGVFVQSHSGKAVVSPGDETSLLSEGKASAEASIDTSAQGASKARWMI